MARFQKSQRMAKRWAFMQGSTADLTGDGTTLGGSLQFAEARTILRMLGEYLIVPTSAPAALDNVTIGIGIAIVSSDAATAGASALPDPIGDPEYPWLHWAQHDLFMPSVGVIHDAGRGVRQSFDSRFMRKVKPKDTLVVVIEYANTAGNPPMHVDVTQVRVLLVT